MAKGDTYEVEYKSGQKAVYHEQYRRRCRGSTCGAEVAFAVDGQRWGVFDPDTGKRHHETCPDVEEFRGSSK